MLPIKRYFNDDFMPDIFSSMRTDIQEKDDHYEMSIELPGFAKEDINISLKDGFLNIEGVRNVKKDETDEKGYVRKERFSGRVSRSYYVGDISEEDVKATYKDGVLSVTYPKADIQETKKISIE